MVMSKFSMVKMRRPNGKLYTAQKGPRAELLYSAGEDQVDSVLVIRTDDLVLAQDMACAELACYDSGYYPVAPRFGWWREGIRDGSTWWEEDPRRGVPGYLFQRVKEVS